MHHAMLLATFVLALVHVVHCTFEDHAMGHQPAARVPYGRGDGPAPARDPAHLAHRDVGLRNELGPAWKRLQSRARLMASSATRCVRWRIKVKAHVVALIVPFT